MDIQCQSYREQYNKNFFCIIPTNIYGPHDNFHLENAHVIPALIHKCYKAKMKNKEFIVRGSGKPLRQFIYSYDLADIILKLIQEDYIENIIVYVNEKDDVSSADVATLIDKEFDYFNMMRFDSNLPTVNTKTANNSITKIH